MRKIVAHENEISKPTTHLAIRVEGLKDDACHQKRSAGCKWGKLMILELGRSWAEEKDGFG